MSSSGETLEVGSEYDVSTSLIDIYPKSWLHQHIWTSTSRTAKMANGAVPFRGLSAYQIPDQILGNLAVRSIQANEQDPATQRHAAKAPPPAPSAAGGGLSCQTCPGVTFGSVEEQRGHFKTDWHRYNAKAKLQGGDAVAAAQWDDMVEGMLRLPLDAQQSN